MKFKKPFFITPHAVERFQERIYDISAAEIINIIQSLLQKRSGLIEFDVKNRKIHELYRKNYKEKPVYVPVVYDKSKEWPVVPTIMGEESIIHGKYVKGEFDYETV